MSAWFLIEATSFDWFFARYAVNMRILSIILFFLKKLKLFNNFIQSFYYCRYWIAMSVWSFVGSVIISTTEWTGTTGGDRKSRSPSPATSAQSLPVAPGIFALGSVRRGRRLPPTPNKPSTLLLLRSANVDNVATNYQLPSVALSPTLAHYRHAGSINFPKVSASPTRSIPSHVTTWSRHEPYPSYRSASTQPPFYGDLRHLPPTQQLPNGCKPGENLIKRDNWQSPQDSHGNA